jgi:regulator of protease activity HflC (stomatin/prohibitin superfamily)
MYNQNGKRIRSFTFPNKKLIGILVIVAICVVAFSSAYTIVPSGNTGVLLTWNTPTAALNQGWNWRVPISQSVIMMNTQIQTVSLQENTGSSDLQEVTSTVTLAYQLDEDNVVWI